MLHEDLGDFRASFCVPISDTINYYVTSTDWIAIKVCKNHVQLLFLFNNMFWYLKKEVRDIAVDFDQITFHDTRQSKFRDVMTGIENENRY